MHLEDHSPLCPPCSTSPHGCSIASQLISRNRKKKKKKAVNFFLCLPSSSVNVVLPDESGSHPTDVFSSYVDKESIMFRKVVPVASSLTSSDNEGDDEMNRRTTDQRRKQAPGGCGICRALKAVLFKTSLMKKIRKRRFEKKIANATNESSVASTYNREWSEEDVPNWIPKAYVAAERKEGVGPPKVSPMASPSLADNEGKGDNSEYWRNKGRRKLSRIFKEFLSETSLAKRIETRKKRNKRGRNNNEEFCEEDEEQRMNSGSDLTNSSMFTNSTVNSSVNSSSSSSSLLNSSRQSFSTKMKSFRSRSKRNLKANLRYFSDKIRTNTYTLKANYSNGPPYSSSNKNKLMSESNTDDQGSSKSGHGVQSKLVGNMEKNNENKNMSCYKSMVSFCFMVMILLGLIFYGKLCAILCTSMLVVSVPLWTNTSNKADHKMQGRP